MQIILFFIKELTFLDDFIPSAKVTKDTMIGELLQIDENVAPMLLNIGMHCLGCPSSQMETIAEAAMVHGIDPDDLVNDINDFIEHDATA